MTGFGLSAFFLILTGFARCDVTQVVTYSTLSVAGIAASISGHTIAFIDVSGPYSGSVSGLISTLGALAGIIGPTSVGFLTEVQVCLIT